MANRKSHIANGESRIANRARRQELVVGGAPRIAFDEEANRKSRIANRRTFSPTSQTRTALRKPSRRRNVLFAIRDLRFAIRDFPFAIRVETQPLSNSAFKSISAALARDT
jgi:hypothetical protein